MCVKYLVNARRVDYNLNVILKTTFCVMNASHKAFCSTSTIDCDGGQEQVCCENLVTVALLTGCGVPGGGLGVQPPSPRNYEVLTKTNRIAN